MVKNVSNTLVCVNLNNNVEQNPVYYDICLSLKHILCSVHGYIHRQGKTHSFRMVATYEERINYIGERGQTIKSSLKLLITSHIWTDTVRLFYGPAGSKNLT